VPGDARSDPVSEMTAADAQFAAALMEWRRRQYVRYSPVFWRPAEGVVGLHERYLRGRISAETTVALRTAHGFIVCERRRSEGLVDDFADQPKCGMLANLSLTLAGQWWVRELQPVAPAAAPGRISGPGFSGTLGPAPEVYDPGGLVFQNEPAGEHTDFDAIERGAAAHGAVLAVIAAAPNPARARELSQKNWSVASDWYVGTPARPDANGRVP
jgi:hypothetical protein